MIIFPINHCKHSYNEKRSKAEKRRQNVPYIIYEFIVGRRMQMARWSGGLIFRFRESTPPISIGRHFPDIPQFDCLVFSIRYETSAISTTINMCYPMQMSSQNSGSLSCGQTPPVPDLQTTNVTYCSTAEMNAI